MENLDPVTPDNLDPVAPVEVAEPSAPVAPVAPEAPAFSWKSKLLSDIQKAPSLQKYEDTPEGLSKAVESHLNLEKLLGNEKVPIPKDANDKEGWARFNKAMKVPEKSGDYRLADVTIPESMKGLTFDKKEFAEVVHSVNATPEQAKALWSKYTQLNMQAYNKALEAHKAKVTEGINSLRNEWGDAYDGNVDLGQTVINKFAGDQESADEITALLLGSPTGIKFLSKIGAQFAENKMGEFQLKRFARSPEEAQNEIDSIRKDPNHPYMSDKASPAEHQRAVDYVNGLYAVVNRNKG
jgi:hypothetical protein